ncbi:MULTISPECIES: hypothetical protein [Natronorubrum]|uniref:Solute carrier family 5 (Low affinity glucose cotransporter), member 4-like protein n=2 Tax=Natronorubrum bangense TaxID=61858 RepID=L9WGK2_9EURY|nr:hypothetical protein [Natronorubrum bangense]ELY48472.1 solute carrier family 5 (low affinity glucose cotransporter), member 4-like protein [Natronorubrum bangense JCM 10635]QCC53849.1 hypothetical protein DV706_04705 [Natronorubrum bangense]
MELSPEEYGAYWRASIYVAAGIVIAFLGTRLTSPLLSHPNAGAIGLGVFLFVTVIFASTFIAMLGVARVVRTAVDAELRR